MSSFIIFLIGYTRTAGTQKTVDVRGEICSKNEMKLKVSSTVNVGRREFSR